MELFGHAVALYYALRRYVSKDRSQYLIMLHVPKLCLTDTIRCKVFPTDSNPDVVKFGRAYSHFTDECGMRLPIGEELKKITCIDNLSPVKGKKYVSKFADGPTDFRLFWQMNSQLFDGNILWGMSVLAHLQQDVCSDTMWQHNLCRCDTSNNKVTYLASGRVVTGKEFREDMMLANIWCHRFFRKLVKNKYGDDITQSWLDEYVCKAFYLAYSESMAANSCKYLVMHEGVFSESEEIADNVIETLIKHGLIISEAQLRDEARELFYGAVACCNTLVNHLARM